MNLLERDAPLRQLDAALQEATVDSGRVVLVSGEAGIGKSSLVEAFTRSHERTMRVLWGACDSLFTPRPLGPLLDVAIQLEGRLPGILTAGVDRHAIFTACFIELQSQPNILVFEDVHWADEATFDLVKFLARRIQRTSSLFILTYRDDELGADHPLRLVLGDLPRAATVRLQLSPLSKSSVAALAMAANQAERSDELYKRTSGNPFFVTEILASKDADMPNTIRDAVLTRAARLSPAARAVLEAAAVIGLRVEPWLLPKVVAADPVTIHECIAGGMLQLQSDAYIFRHELARQTILQTILPERRLDLHRIVLSVLKEAPQTRNDLARLANHAEGTGDISAVLEYAPAAARYASAASAHREAITLYELGLRFAGSLSPSVHAEILEAYAIELWYGNRVSDSIDIYHRAIELRHATGDYVREGDNYVPLAEASYLLGRNADAEEASQSAITILEHLPPGPELGRAYRSRCFMRMINRDCAEAVSWGQKAIALAERFDDRETLARACNYAGCALMVLDHERGNALMARSLAIGRAANLPFAIGGTLTNWGWMLLELYQPLDASQYLTEGIAYATEHDDNYHLRAMQAYQAWGLFHEGRWTEAIQSALPVAHGRYQDLETRTYAYLALGYSSLRRGDESGLQALDEARELAERATAIQRLGPVHAARAEAAWMIGDHDGAIREARQGYDLAVKKEHPWIAGQLAFWRWRAGDDFRPPSWIAAPFAMQMAGDWRGAASEWQRRGCPFEQALALADGDQSAQLSALDVFDRLGARPAAAKLKQQLRVQGVPRIPRGPRAAARDNPYALTSREMEVLACLVKGASNRAIAGELSLSTRTVEHHVASILQKLQVKSRNEAVALALAENLLSSTV